MNTAKYNIGFDRLLLLYELFTMLCWSQAAKNGSENKPGASL